MKSRAIGISFGRATGDLGEIFGDQHPDYKIQRFLLVRIPPVTPFGASLFIAGCSR